jgi:hypothetical protein
MLHCIILLSEVHIVRFLVTWEAVEHEGPYVIFLLTQYTLLIVSQWHLRSLLSQIHPLASFTFARLRVDSVRLSASRRMVTLLRRVRCARVDAGGLRL